MMNVMRHLIHPRKGFTLIEILIVTALMGIITVATSSFFWQTVKTDQSSKVRLMAVRNLDTAGNWLISDFQSARTVPAVVTLTPGDGKSLTIYQMLDNDDMTTLLYSIDSAGDLRRTAGSGAALIAQNISSVDYTTGTASTPGAIVITSTIGSEDYTKTYKVGSRISDASAKLTILNRELPGADVNVDYYQVVMAYGGIRPYLFEVTSAAGTFPSWATLSSTEGEITGKSTYLDPDPAANTFTFTIRVTDAMGATASQQYTITVSPRMTGIYSIPEAVHRVVDNTDWLPLGYIGDSYPPVQFLVTSGGTNPYYWSLKEPSAWPAGLDLSLNGVLTGTPAGPSEVTKSVTVMVTDSAGDTLETTRWISVVPIPCVFTQASIKSPIPEKHNSWPTTVEAYEVPYPCKKLIIKVKPQNNQYDTVIKCSIKNMISVPAKIKGYTFINDSQGVISVTFGGGLDGNTVIPVYNASDPSTIIEGTVELKASNGGGPFNIVITYDRI